MQDQTWFNGVAIAAVAAVLILGAGLFMVGGSGSPTPAGARTATLPQVDRTLAISFNAATGSYDFSTTSLQVPLNTKVTFTITNYDRGTAMLAVPWDNHVVGTVGGTEQVTQGASSVTVSALSPEQISHTFTMFNAFYNVSVPIPPAAANGQPAVVTFSLVLTTPGTFAWGCVAYCGTMNPLEKMAGTMDIAA